MTVRLEGRATAGIIVTLVAVTDTTGIVRPGAAYEGCRGMAGTAIQRGRDVNRIGLRFLTNGYRTVMARFAIIHYAGVVEPRTDETRGGMTDTAVLVGR